MCEIHIDSLFVMWAIGGGFLGWAGMKAFRKWRYNKSKTIMEKFVDGVNDGSITDKSGKKNVVQPKPDDSP